MLEHTSLVNNEREALERIGYNVYIESQNLFRLKGQTATIVGKPDLIGEKYHEILISDAKTGKPEPFPPGAGAHLPVRCSQDLPAVTGQGHPRPGQVRYPDSYAGSPASAVNPEFVGNMGALIRRLAADESARRALSPQEYRFCDISKEDCPARIDVDYVPEGATDDF